MSIKRIKFTIFIGLMLCQSALCKDESHIKIDEVITKMNETQSKVEDNFLYVYLSFCIG